MNRTDIHNKAANQRIYLPSGERNVGFAAWLEMVQETLASRELIWRFFLRDFSVRYRQSILGYLWAIVPPILSTATFAWLNRANILPVKGTGLPYPLFVLLNTAVWQLFSGGLASATQSLSNAGSLITKINFPRESLVISAFGQSIFEFLIRAVLLFIAFVLFRTVPHWTIVLVPVLLVALCALTLGLGFICSMVNGVVRDAGQAITLLLGVWMFLTPVVYPPPASGLSLRASLINPMSAYIVAAQDLVIKGHLTQPVGLAAASVLSMVLLAIGWRVFHLTETRIAERV
jgi:lipopolysaccharide transport system permease protein